VSEPWTRVKTAAAADHGQGRRQANRGPGRHYALRAREDDFEAFLAAHPRLLERDLLRAHYLRERLFGEAARAAFVEPDLLTLP
jgi:hypothetical protein